MGLFKKLKKAFKKVTGFVKKVVKKTVKTVKKIGKKIGSSKILKALAIAAAVVVTGGAALTAFGGTGALASSQVGSWMMTTSQNILGGKAFGVGAAKSGLPKLLTQAGNFAAKTVAAPFGAVGGAIGSTARVGANLLTPNTTAFQAGPAGAGTSAAAPKPFSGAALRGQTVNNVPAPAGTTPKVQPKTFGQKVGSFVSNVGTNVASGVLTGYATEAIMGDDPTGRDAPLRTEGATQLDPLRVYASEQGIDVSSIYSRMSYGNVDPSFAAGADLYKQQTFGVA